MEHELADEQFDDSGVVAPEIQAPVKQPSIRDSIKAAMKGPEIEPEVTSDDDSEPSEAPEPKKAEKDVSKSKAPTEEHATQKANKPVVAPAAWPKEARALWNTLPPTIQVAVSKREADGSKGVEELKTRYQDLENAVAPYRDGIKRFRAPDGKPITEGDAVRQLFQWQAWLAGPDKAGAFRALAQSHNFDLNSLAGSPQGTANTSQQQFDPSLQPIIPILDGIVQRLNGYEAQSSAQVRNAADQTVASWSADKPHFEQVRQLMAQLTQSGVVPLLPTGQVDLDGAYNAACKLHPEVAAQIAEEQEQAVRAARNARNQAARQAGSSIRPGAPAAPAGMNGTKTRKVETARESIRRAIEESRQQ